MVFIQHVRGTGLSLCFDDGIPQLLGLDSLTAFTLFFIPISNDTWSEIADVRLLCLICVV